MAQVAIGGGFFAIGGGGGGCFCAIFRAGIFRCESKVAACRSLPTLELSPQLRGKPVERRTND
jgi:hypothetical protein